MIKAIIVEDEKKSRDLLQNLLTKHCPQIVVIGATDSVEKGVELIKAQAPDLLFLDIVMPDGTGFDLLERVPNISFEVIFTTATDKYAIKAIKYSALDYLLKPIDIDELVVAVNKVASKKTLTPNIENLKFLLENFKRNDENYQRITLPTGNAYEIINIKDIVRCEAEGNYTNFILTNNRKLMVSTGLKHYEDILPSSFIRVHHHHLINSEHVLRYLKVDGGYAVMTDGSQVEISRRKKEAFMQYINRA